MLENYQFLARVGIAHPTFFGTNVGNLVFWDTTSYC